MNLFPDDETWSYYLVPRSLLKIFERTLEALPSAHIVRKVSDYYKDAMCGYCFKHLKACDPTYKRNMRLSRLSLADTSTSKTADCRFVVSEAESNTACRRNSNCLSALGSTAHFDLFEHKSRKSR